METKRLYFGTGLVSTVISKPHKRLYCPVLRFKYKSAKEESYLKNLAMLPNIKSKFDLKAYVDFYKKHGLKECYINMTKNNPAKEYSDKMIENFRKTNSDFRVWQVMRISNNEVLKSYYIQNNIQRPKLYSCDFTLDSFIQYSNIEWIAKSELVKFPDKSQDLQKKLKKLFEIYKYKLKTDSFRFLLFNPYYEIVKGSKLKEKSSLPSQIDQAQLPQIDHALPSTSTATNLSFEFKRKPKVATKSDKRKPISDADVDLTLDNIEHVIVTDVEDENVATTSSSTQETIPNEDSDDEEDKLDTIAMLLISSSSFVTCVRDIYQTQMYLTATDWHMNMEGYVYKFLKSNMSLEIIKYIKVFNVFTKEYMVELINKYLSTQNQQETLQTVVNQPETSNNIDKSTSNTSVDSLNKDPHMLQIKQEPIKAKQILDIIDISSDSEHSEPSESPCIVRDNTVVNEKQQVSTIEDKPDLSTIQTSINVLENVVFIDANLDLTDQLDVDSLLLDCLAKVKEEQINEAECQNTFSEVEIVELVEQVIEIDSDSERSESILCNELNIIDDKIMTISNSDMYLKSAEQGDTQQELIINTDPIATCSTNNDSKLEQSYNSITYQAHIDDQHETKKRKMTLNAMNRIETAMNEPSAKRVANKENVTLRKNPNVPVVMASKPSTRNIYMQDSSSDEILQPLQPPGNNDFNSHINEVLNHEYSVFLSSQIVSSSCEDEHDINSTNENKIKVPSINFTNQINPDVTIANHSATCFYVKIVCVRFQKDQFFKITINIPQFNFYSIDIEDENIKTLLNLNAPDWTTLKFFLNSAITYTYVQPKKDDATKSSNTNSTMFTTSLDNFFETLSEFKTFYLNSTNNSLIYYDAGVPANLNINLSSTIEPSVLEAMKRLKSTGSIN